MKLKSKPFEKAENFAEAQSIHFKEIYPKLSEKFAKLQFEFNQLKSNFEYNKKLVDEYKQLIEEYKNTNKNLLKLIEDGKGV